MKGKAEAREAESTSVGTQKMRFQIKDLEPYLFEDGTLELNVPTLQFSDAVLTSSAIKDLQMAGFSNHEIDEAIGRFIDGFVIKSLARLLASRNVFQE